MTLKAYYVTATTATLAWSSATTERTTQTTEPAATTTSTSVGANSTFVQWAFESPSGEPGGTWSTTASDYSTSLNCTTMGANLVLSVARWYYVTSPGFTTGGIRFQGSGWSSTTGTGVKTITSDAGPFNSTPTSAERFGFEFLVQNTNTMSAQTMTLTVGSSTWYQGDFTVAGADPIPPILVMPPITV